jgi:hypothetical protein
VVGNVAWETVKGYLWTDPFLWTAGTALVMGLLAILWEWSLPAVGLAALASGAFVVTIWNQAEMLVQRREPVAAIGAEPSSRPAVPTLTPFIWGAVRWDLTDRFWRAYQTMEEPAYQFREDYLIGPICRNCGRSLKKLVRPSPGSGYPASYAIEHPCPSCLQLHGLQNVTYGDAKREAYKRAQAAARQGTIAPTVF